MSTVVGHILMEMEVRIMQGTKWMMAVNRYSFFIFGDIRELLPQIMV